MAQTSSSYNILLSNSGTGLLTPTVIRNATTPASGGTAITIPWVENENANGGTGATSTLLPGVAVQAAFRAIADDISAGN